MPAASRRNRSSGGFCWKIRRASARGPGLPAPFCARRRDMRAHHGRIDHLVGGRRWWFQCPRTGRRTTKLFLPNGGQHFWSRAGYGLGYACQREGSFDRLQRRAAMLNRQLGGKGWATWESPPPKPKWMRRRTYERKYEGWRRVVERANAEFTIKAMRILRRPAMSGRIGRSRRP